MRRFVFVLSRRRVARGGTPRTAASAGGWVRPVPGAVVRGFDPPASRFGAGHLGADLAAPPGTPVRAAGPGVVSFAGTVAGAKHVVIAHAGNLRTSYSFLASISVRRGETVRAGQTVGTTGGRGEGHDGIVLHVGLRVGRHVSRSDDAVRSARPHRDRAPRAHVGAAASGERGGGAPRPARRPRATARGAVVHLGAAALEAAAARSREAFPVQAALAHGVRDWIAQRRQLRPARAVRPTGKAGRVTASWSSRASRAA